MRSSSVSNMLDVSTRTTLQSWRDSIMFLVTESLGSLVTRSRRKRFSRRRLMTLMVPSWYFSPRSLLIAATERSFSSTSQFSP